MRLDRRKSPSRPRGARSFFQAKNRYYPTRGERNGNSIPSADNSSLCVDTSIPVGFEARPLQDGVNSFAQEGRGGLSDTSTSDLNEDSSIPTGYLRESSELDSTLITRGPKGPSDGAFGGKSRKRAIHGCHQGEKISPANLRPRHISGGGQSIRQLRADVYDDAFSRGSTSKSRTSSDSSASYSTYDDEEDDDYQMNANCMNALFGNDARKASNIIRCDKAGPSATEVRLKMTLPLPAQFMERFDNFVPTKQEVETAIEHMKVNGDRIAKKCDLDYNRLDEQVIIDDVAGGAMPQFYKSLFEAPTEMSSDGDEESYSRRQPRMSPVCRRPTASAFTPNPNIFKAAPSGHLADSAQSVDRPRSLPSHVNVDGSGSFVSSQDSLELMPFGSKRRSEVSKHAGIVPHDFRKSKMVLQTSDRYMQVSGMIDSDPSFDIPPLQQDHKARSSPVQPSMRDLIASQTGAIKPTQTQTVTTNSKPRREDFQPHFRLQGLTGSMANRIEKSGSISMQENPSFDEGEITPRPASLGDSSGPSQEKPSSQGKPTPGFDRGSKMCSAASVGWVAANKEQLDLVDQAYSSFDAPHDEVRASSGGKLGSHGITNDLNHNGIPSLVGVEQLAAKEVHNACSDLTSDDDAFESPQYPVVQSLSLSNHSLAEVGDIGAVTPQNRRVNHDGQFSWEPETTIKRMASGDELMGKREEIHVSKEDAEDEVVGQELSAPDQSHQGGKSGDDSPKEQLLGTFNNLTGQNLVARTEQPMLPRPGSGLLASSAKASEHSSKVNDAERKIENLFPIPGTPTASWNFWEINATAETAANSTRPSCKEISIGDIDFPVDEPGPDLLTGPQDGNLKASVAHGSLTGRCDPSALSDSKDSFLNCGDLKASAEVPQAMPSWSSDVPFDQDINVSMDGQDISVSMEGSALQYKSEVPSNVQELPPGQPHSSSGESKFQDNSHDQESEVSSNLVQDQAEIPSAAENTSPSVQDPALTISDGEATSSKCPIDFSARLRNAAAARLEAMNDVAGPVPQCSVDESSPEQRHQTSSSVSTTREESRMQTEETPAEENRTECCHTYCLDQMPAYDEMTEEILENEEDNGKRFQNTLQDEDEGSEEFQDASYQEMLEVRSEDRTRESNEWMRFLPEIDARSQAVEINYIGDRSSRAIDAESLATEPPLMIAPTTTTMETPLTAAHTMLTMDTPVLSPPGESFDTSERENWGPTGKNRKGFRKTSESFYHSEEEDDDDGTDYHFDERLAKLSALLPASKIREGSQRPTSFNFVHLCITYITAFLIFIYAWIRHIFSVHGRFNSGTRSAKGEPTFLNHHGPLHMQALNSEEIQGGRIDQDELRHMEREAGIYIDFVVPDVHGQQSRHYDQPIWTVNSKSQSNSNRVQKITETYSSIRQTFSRGDAKSVASMQGWIRQPNSCYTDFREE